MKNIVFKFVCVFTIFMGMTYCSPNLNEDDFLRSMTGQYTLTQTGREFIIRELAGYVTTPVIVGEVLEMRGDGSLYILFPAVAPAPAVTQKIAQFIRVESEGRGLYRLESVNTYVAMGKADATLPLLISTANGEKNEDDVLFEHPVPIAKEKEST